MKFIFKNDHYETDFVLDIKNCKVLQSNLLDFNSHLWYYYIVSKRNKSVINGIKNNSPK